jgi:SH3-like domain-containing protein
MKTQNGFTLLETEKEFKEWLDKQHPTRKITRLQVHHMALPDYSTWNNTDKRVYGDNRELGRTLALDAYGKQTWHSSDGYGHYIAQHFSIFPNGKITTGRNLNSTPIGIAGWNSNAICVEIYGNFDKGQDIMTKEQRKAVIFVFALLAEKFSIPKTSTYIRPHAWFTSGGTCLWNYYPGKSRKTCPGTNFMGFGNTKKAFENNFYPLLKAYKYGSSSTTTAPIVDTTEDNEYKVGIYEVTADVLNVRNGANASYTKVGSLNKGEQVVISKIENNWGYVKDKNGWISLAYTKFVKAETEAFKQYIIRTTADVLNGRKEPTTNSEIVCKLNKGTAVTIVAKEGKWLKTKVGYYIYEDYVEFVKYI